MFFRKKFGFVKKCHNFDKYVRKFLIYLANFLEKA